MITTAHLLSTLLAGLLLTAGRPEAVATPPPGCTFAADNDYYAIELVTTRRVPGSGLAKGSVDVSYERNPFGIAVTEDGSYRYDLSLHVERLQPPRSGAYVAWVTTPQLDRIVRLGTLDADHRLEGRVAWNKFLVVITLEPDADADTATWQGPIVLRGLSRSGLMHTMAGHGAFAREPCATYGY